MIKSSRPHDEIVVELLQDDPTFADEYLTAALDEANQLGGSGTASYRGSQGMAIVAERAGIPRESLSLSTKSNPTNLAGCN